MNEGNRSPDILRDLALNLIKKRFQELNNDDADPHVRLIRQKEIAELFFGLMKENQNLFNDLQIEKNMVLKLKEEITQR